MSRQVDGPNGRNLWQRADRTLPGGLVYISRSARMAGANVLPGFMRSADGCRVTDVDGREYIDFLCGNGPNLLGYRNPEVDTAAGAQAHRSDLTSFFPELMVEYAERLLAWQPQFSWVVHGKNGSDVVALATRVMRNHTRRPILILFEGAYHGFGNEVALHFEGIPGDALKHVVRLPWNDPEALVEAARRHGSQIAGILLNPLDQRPAAITSAPSSEFINAIETLRQDTGALLALDDVRHGFRLHPDGSHRKIGIDPDLICLGKAMANGYATSALLGVESLRRACSEIQFTASFMFSPVCYAAGIATLEIYQRDRVFEQLETMGNRLARGLEEAGRDAGQQITVSGPTTMPTLLFEGEQTAERAQHFAQQAALRGAIFHPSLNWFLSAAHTTTDIDQAIAIAREAFRAIPPP